MNASDIINAANNMPWAFWGGLAASFFLFLFARNGQRWINILLSYRNIKKLAALSCPKQQFYQLRRTNPFLFEEMILTAFKHNGCKIIRNKRYTHDGGIDGRVMLDGVLHLIQAKRYKGHINPSHVLDFLRLCQEQNTKGLFIHTGKTGKKSRVFADNDVIDIISGRRMLALFSRAAV